MPKMKASYVVASLLAINVFSSIIINNDVYADTSAAAENDATVTVHVLPGENQSSGGGEGQGQEGGGQEGGGQEGGGEGGQEGGTTPTPSNVDHIDDDTNPDTYEDAEAAAKDPIVDEVNLEDGSEDDSLVTNDGEVVDEKERDDDASNQAAGGAATTYPQTPDTGANENGLEGGSANFPTIILMIVVVLAVVVLAMRLVRRVQWDKTAFALSRGLGQLRRRVSPIGFSGERHRYTYRYALSGLGIVVGVFACISLYNSIKAPVEDVDATGETTEYPYTISLTNDNHFDVYVKQGEFKRAAFKITTSTNNPTGYTLSFGTTKQKLDSQAGGTINTTTSDVDTANFADNTWGFSTDGNNYKAIPGSSKSVLRTTSGASASGNYAVIYFGVKVAEDLAVGDYTSTVSFKTQTNLVKKTLKLGNGNVATVTRVSDGKKLANDAEIYVGEQLKVSNSADASGSTQSLLVDDKAVSNNSIVSVTKNVKVSTADDSIHFLKNGYDKDNTVSNGDAILIKSQGKYWLVDTGWAPDGGDRVDGNKLASYLKALGINKVDNILLTHMHSDHMGGLNTLVKKGYVRADTTVYMRGCKAIQDRSSEYETYNEPMTSYVNRCEKIKQNLSSIKITTGGATTTESAKVIDLYEQETERAKLAKSGVDFGNFHVDFYNIDKASNGHINFDHWRENLNSIGLKLTHKPSGKTTFLAADMEYGNEAKYASKIGKVDILKAGHHGVKTSSTYDFMKTLSPKTVIVTSSNAASSAGNPIRQEAAWAYIEQKGGSVYFTGDSTGSAVAINFTSSNYSVKKGKKQSVTADANTGNKKDSTNYHRKVGPNTWNWNGGVYAWSRPQATTGKGGVKVYYNMASATDSKHSKVTNYVYVYQTVTKGNVISVTDMCIDKYCYGFKKDNGDGVSNLRTKK